MEENNTCNYCGNVIEASQKDCPHCGAKNPKFKAAPTENTNQTTPSSNTIITKYNVSTENEDDGTNDSEGTKKFKSPADKLAVTAFVFSFIFWPVSLVLSIISIIFYAINRKDDSYGTSCRFLAYVSIVISAISLISQITRLISWGGTWSDIFTDTAEYEFSELFD